MQPTEKHPRTDIEVPLLDLKSQYLQIREEVLERIARVCESQQFILGGPVSELERLVADYSQCRHGIGVSSGSDALLVALMALDIGNGDEVITSPFTFFATAGAVTRVGARPLFCDIDPATFNISSTSVERLIARDCERRAGKLVNRRTGGTVKALLPVHLFGQMAHMDPLMHIAGDLGLRVVEDAAQAIGAECHGRRAGGVGDIGCFSFFPTKNLGAFGDAGMCTTNSPELAERLEVLRVHGSKPKYYHALIGGNFRIDALQAAVLLSKFPHLESWTEKRRQNAVYYDAAFARLGADLPISRPEVLAGHRHIYNQYVIRVDRRDDLRQYLAEAKIGTEIYYPVPLHLQRCFAYLGYGVGDFPNAERAANEVLALPIYPELTTAQQDYVVETIAEFYR